MRWVRYRSDGKTFYGILHGNTIEEVYGTPFDSYTNSGMVHLYEEVELLPPVIPPTFYAAGVNYEKHVLEAAALLGINPITLDRLAKRGLIRPSRAIRRPLYPHTELVRFLEETKTLEL